MTKEEMMQITSSKALAHAMLGFPNSVDSEVNDRLMRLACEEEGIERPEDGFLWTPSDFGTVDKEN